MGKAAQMIATWLLAAAFGFGGASAALLTFHDSFQGPPGPAGPRGATGARGPMGPEGPQGEGVQSLTGGYVVSGLLGCPPGTSGLGAGSVVTDVNMTPGVQGLSAPWVDVQTEGLCRIGEPWG